MLHHSGGLWLRVETHQEEGQTVNVHCLRNELMISLHKFDRVELHVFLEGKSIASPLLSSTFTYTNATCLPASGLPFSNHKARMKIRELQQEATVVINCMKSSISLRKSPLLCILLLHCNRVQLWGSQIPAIPTKISSPVASESSSLQLKHNCQEKPKAENLWNLKGLIEQRRGQ
jgi:hypothetical protein